MSWVVDTCVLIDILENDPEFGRKSARCLSRHLSDGLLVCPVTMVELSPAFEGALRMQQKFLSLCGVASDVDWLFANTERAHQAWNVYIRKKRLQETRKRPVADLLIGAFATRFDGLITRNPKDFKPWFPELKIIQP